MLIAAARHTVDAQYYLWHADLTGTLLLGALRDAADRGVRVRLLLDDNGISGLDAILAELDAHPNVAVRLYNPFTLRPSRHGVSKFFGYGFDFRRLNRRMHNKSLTVDGVATISGGRNVGDEYFGTGPRSVYVDLDILAIGAVVDAVARDFARYWDARASFPAASFLPSAPGTGSPLDEATARVEETARFRSYREAVENADTVQELVSGALSLEWTNVTFASDDPAKTLGSVGSDGLLVTRIDRLMNRVERRLDVISSYFVPGDRGVEEFERLEAAGVDVRILTNAMEATDVAPVHAGYAKYRRRLLEAGVELFEMKSENAQRDDRSDLGVAGSSGASLHAKTFAADGERIYVGSFNFDPRSANLNTELGFLIDSERLATRIHESFDDILADVAYRLRLDADGNIEWRERLPEGRERVYRTEPRTSLAQRALTTAIGWLPIQWLL